MRVCAEPGCPALVSDGSRCSTHKPQAWATSKRKQRTTLSGWAQQRRAKRILQQYHTFCHVCGQPGANEVDHVIPLSEGGADTDENLRPIHSTPCHRDKTQAERHH